MKIGIIGVGAIGRFVQRYAVAAGYDVAALLLRPERLRGPATQLNGAIGVADVADLPGDIEHVLDCAGHSALRAYGTAILRRGMALTTVSLGALADQSLLQALERAAIEGDTRLHLASGAIGGLDCLRAARIGHVQQVTYIGRKPPLSWQGSPAESRLDLEGLTTGAATHFAGSARDAAVEYPKNANVAAAVALAGIGFDETEVKLIADADISENIHEIQTVGDFGSFHIEIRGHSLPDNPRSSALAAMSVISKLHDASNRIAF